MFNFKKLSYLILCNLIGIFTKLNYSYYFLKFTFKPIDRIFRKTASKVLKMGR